MDCDNPGAGKLASGRKEGKLIPRGWEGLQIGKAVEGELEPIMAHLLVNEPSVGTEQDYLSRNLAILRQRNSALAAEIFALDPDSSHSDYPGWHFDIRPAKNGQPVMYAIGDDTEVALHSTYDPAREAADQVRGVIGDGKRNYYVVLGMGLGYAVELLLAEEDKETKVLVIEAHLRAFRKAIETRDLRAILNDPRVIITLGTRVDEAIAAFMRRYALAYCTGVGFMELPARKRLPSDSFYTAFIERLKGVIVTTGGNLQTLMTMAWTYQRNTMQSLSHVIDSPPVRKLFGLFEGKPGIIISAGPSLIKNINRLAEIRDRAVLIAVDTSLRPLLAAGIEPHLICTGDPQEANWKHLRGTVTHDPFLIAEPMTYPLSLEHFKKRLFIASYGDKTMEWLSRHMPDVGHVMCWGSVATMAFDLARKMGCDPIIFVGQDLSFPGGRTYVPGTYFEVEEKQDMSVEAFEKNHVTYTITDIYGQPVKTNRQMFAYKEWFRSEFAVTKARIVNATEGGILKENCEIMPFDEAIARLLGEPFEIMEKIRTASAGFEGYDLKPLQQGLFEIIDSMRRCIEYCAKGTERVTEVARAMEKMDKLPPLWCKETIKELDDYRFKLRDEAAMKSFLEAANQTGVLNFHRAYKAINGKDFSRVVFGQALDLFTDLFMSCGRVSRALLPFFVSAYKSIAGRSGAVEIDLEEKCLTNG